MIQRLKFTDAKISALPFEENGQQLHWDEDQPGFGLVVGKTAKSFVVQKAVGGKERRVTIGRFGHWRTEGARKEARRLLVEMDSGIDPAEKKKNALWDQHLRTITLKSALEEHLKRDLKPSTIAGYTATINCIFQDWMEKPLVDITREQVLKKYQETSKRAPIHADLAMRTLRAVIESASRSNRTPTGGRLIVENPVDIIGDNGIWAKAKARTRVLSDDELPDWFKAIESIRSDETILGGEVGSDFLEFVLYTGFRRTEAQTLQWSAIDFEKKVIRLADTKNGKPHTLPITDHIVSILNRRQQHGTKWVFQSCGRNVGEGHFAEPRHVIEHVEKRSRIKSFTTHDLRRTFATIGLRNHSNAFIVKRLLNHTVSGDVTFNHYFAPNLDDMRPAMQVITDHLLSMKARALGLRLTSA